MLHSYIYLILVRFLGRFRWFLVPLYTVTKLPNGKAISSFPRLRLLRNSTYITDDSSATIRLIYSSLLYTEKALRAAKLCKHLLREPSNDALFTTLFIQTVGSDPRLVNGHNGDQSWVLSRVAETDAPFVPKMRNLLASISPQAAQSRKVNNYKDLYGNLDNRLKKIFTRKSSQ